MMRAHGCAVNLSTMAHKRRRPREGLPRSTLGASPLLPATSTTRLGTTPGREPLSTALAPCRLPICGLAGNRTQVRQRCNGIVYARVPRCLLTDEPAAYPDSGDALGFNSQRPPSHRDESSPCGLRRSFRGRGDLESDGSRCLGGSASERIIVRVCISTGWSRLHGGLACAQIPSLLRRRNRFEPMYLVLPPIRHLSISPNRDKHNQRNTMLRKLSRLLHWGQSVCDMPETTRDVADIDKRVNYLERSQFKRQRNRRKAEASQNEMINSLLSNVAPIVAMYLTNANNKSEPAIPRKEGTPPGWQRGSTDPRDETITRILQTLAPMAQFQTDLVAKLETIEADLALLKSKLPANTH